MILKINLRSQNIKVQFKQQAIKIYNDDELSILLQNDAEELTSQLVNRIKVEYYKLFNTEFSVSNDSMSVEIWAHVYAEKFAEAIKHFSSVKLIDAFAEKIIQHADEIDIGEKGHDENRFVWDALQAFKSSVAKILFKTADE